MTKSLYLLSAILLSGCSSLSGPLSGCISVTSASINLKDSTGVVLFNKFSDTLTICPPKVTTAASSP
jgi:hypothetical protein